MLGYVDDPFIIESVGLMVYSRDEDLHMFVEGSLDCCFNACRSCSDSW